MILGSTPSDSFISAFLRRVLGLFDDDNPYRSERLPAEDGLTIFGAPFPIFVAFVVSFGLLAYILFVFATN